ncbi:MAG: tetratricopeptide repeat protein [Alphaproteobacteria bacterium]
MTRNTFIALAALALSSFGGSAFAEDAWTMRTPQSQPVPQAVETAAGIMTASPMDQDIADLQKEWAHIKYQMSNEDQQLEAIHRLEAQAASVSAKYPANAEPKIWEGIILSTDAGIVKGISALGKVKKAKELFETSLKQNPTALDGSAHTSLGSLYYQVPGWPVAFGDDEEAEKHLKQALRLNPNGIDPNYFYGDFLLEDGRYSEAKTYLNRALQAPDRPSRPLADAGRRQEIKAALAQIDQKMKNKNTSKYN